MNHPEESDQLRELIRNLVRKLGVLQDQQVSCFNVSVAQCHALVEIGRAKSMSLNELADKLNLDSSTMSRTVNKLVVNSLVKRDVHPGDRRYITISLTESGNDYYQSVEEDMKQYYHQIYTSIPANKQEQVIESIQILLDSISKGEL